MTVSQARMVPAGRADRRGAIGQTVGMRSFSNAAHGLRGIASIMVLIAHILGGTARHIYPDQTAYVRFVEHPWYFGTFGVEIFFVISGFVIVPSALKYNLAEFALRRFVRIYPLFFLLSIIFIGLNAHTNSYAAINNMKSIVAGLTFTNLFTRTEQLTPNAWSLTFEIMYYALTATVVKFAIKDRDPVTGGIAIAAAATFFLYFPITIYFLIGVGLRLTFARGRVPIGVARFGELGSLASLIWFASRRHFDYGNWGQFLDPVVLPLLLSTASYLFFAFSPGSITERLLGGSVFRYLGDVSYSLYLVHPFAYYALRLLFAREGWFTGNVAWSMAVFAAAVIAASLVATHAAHHLLERWPYRAVFHQNVYRKKNGNPVEAM